MHISLIQKFEFEFVYNLFMYFFLAKDQKI